MGRRQRRPRSCRRLQELCLRSDRPHPRAEVWATRGCEAVLAECEAAAAGYPRIQPIHLGAQSRPHAPIFARVRRSCGPVSVRKNRTHADTHRCFSSSHRSSNICFRVSVCSASAVTLPSNSSRWSSTLSLRLVWFRDDRHVSATINAAATEKRNPSASAFAPFSIALV